MELELENNYFGSNAGPNVFELGLLHLDYISLPYLSYFYYLARLP